VARRYAEAVFGLAGQQNAYDTWATDLDRLAALLTMTVNEKALTSPAVPVGEKLNVLQAEAPGLQPQTMNLIKLLLHRERLGMLPQIAAAYHELLNRQRGIEVAHVVTAIPLDAQTRSQLVARLTAYSGKQIELEETVDPSILGGVIVRLGDTLLDGSVRGRLEALRRRLVATG
jgi:F-type H+-transporting ATPase subunit delta